MHVSILKLLQFALPWSGIAPGLPTDLKPTQHMALVQLVTPTVVVGPGGADAVELDTSKRSQMLCLYL